MHMTMANFALFLPDWNSLDSVRRAHSGLEGAALVFFALLVVFDVLAHLSEENKERERLLERIGLCCFAVAVLAEIVAYPYSQRNDALSDQKIRFLDAVAHDADSTATGAKTTADGAKIKADAADTVAGNAVGKANTATTSAIRARGAASDALTQAAEVDKYADLIAFKVSWRMVDGKKFHELMAGKPIGTAEIWFEPDDEAFNFGWQIARVLKDAGWKVSDPEPMPTDRKWSRKPPMTVLDDLRINATMNGLAIGSKHLTILEERGAVAAFVEALERSMGREFSDVGGEYPSLPDNHVVIAVGRHVAYIPPLNPYAPKTENTESTNPSKKNAKP
jgi:hypothetical protein